MNFITKAYCRIFQGCFRLAFPFLPYREPEIYRRISDIVDLLKDKGIKTVLLVTDQGLRNAGVTASLEKLLDKNDIVCIVYDKNKAQSYG